MEQGEGQKPGRRREPTGELVGSYAVISQIASGEATTVHLAQKQGALGFHRLAAIKRLKPAFAKNSEWKQLLLDEARISAGVHHVNIVDVIDVGTDNGCYLVMDYVEGSDLAELLARAGKERHPRYVLPPIVDALHGLQATHTALDEEGELLGLVHQAPTARHMLLGIDGTARLTDFSQVSAQGLLPSHLRYGRLKSPHMAPEQLRGNNPVDARTDVFIVGITLWEALTGERLFHADTMELSRRAVLERHIPRPSDVGLRPPRALDALCLRALARNPNERFQSAAEMARELRDIGLNEALFATSGEVGQWVRALAGRALIERRRAIGADAPSAELAIDTLTLDEGGSLTGSSATSALAATPSRVGPAPLPPVKPANDRSPVAGEPSRVTRLYTVAVAAPPGSSVPPSASSLPGSGTLLGAPRIEPVEPKREGASHALEVPPSARRGERRDSGQPSPGAYRHIASDRRGLATLPETAGARPEAAPKLSALAARLAGEAPDEPAHPQPTAGSTENAPKSPGTALALSSASRQREEGAYRAPALPRSQWPDDAYGAGRGQARFAEADGSLRPPNRAAHMDFPGDEERESSSGLGFIAVLSAAIIVLAGVVGIRQWSAEREAERAGKSTAGAPQAEPAASGESAAPAPAAPPTAPLPAASAAEPSEQAQADAGSAKSASDVAAPAAARRPGLQPAGARPALRKPFANPAAANAGPQFAPQRPPMRGPGADLPVKQQHVGLPDNPY